MPKLDTIVLRCLDPKVQRAFYCDVLGMEERSDLFVGYPGNGATLCFLPAVDAYAPGPEDLYWKIALAVPDLDLACRELKERGIPVGEPEQFGDIGYLAHSKDPEGFTIELIAHCFKGEPSPQPVDPVKFGGGAFLNLLTLRSSSAAAISAACTSWGMKRLAIMPVERYGFTLYFYAFTEEQPPSPDPAAIENRTWLYQRSYTVFEVQHRPSLAGARVTGEGQAGYVETLISGQEERAPDETFRVRFVAEPAKGPAGAGAQ